MKFILFRHGHSLANQESRIVSSLENGTRTTGGPEGTGFGLSSRGADEVEESARSLAGYILASTSLHHHARIRILASPFHRTLQTAAIIDTELRAAIELHTAIAPQHTHADVEGAEPEQIIDLRERFFGEFEMQTPSEDLYSRVWHEDENNPFHEQFGVESVGAVTRRMTGVIRQEEVRERQRQQQQHSSHQDTSTTSIHTSTTATTQATTALGQESWVIIVSHGDSLQILQTAMRGWSGDRHRQLKHLNTAEWRDVQWCEELAASHQ
ncbi:hypothetical protein BGZ98_000384 [Dissophora globulifera]|nr:hypothetical protein BGZ98_000384 [Dissophora globulifera]